MLTHFGHTGFALAGCKKTVHVSRIEHGWCVPAEMHATIGARGPYMECRVTLRLLYVG